jgi:type 1 glutamine amidotransferase
MWGPGENGRQDIYVGCIGEQATWSWRGTRTGLQRLVPVRGGGTFEYHSIKATPEGFEIRFTQPADRTQLEDPKAYNVRQWRYVPTPDYGGEKIDEETLRVTEATAAPSGLSVRLRVEGLDAGRCVFIRADVESAARAPIWSPDAWYTLNEIPGREQAAPYERLDDGGLDVLVFSKTAGFRHDSIEAGVACIEGLGETHGFDVEATEDAGLFNDDSLSRFDVVVFLNTTGDVLDPSQEAAFERFIRAGRGYVGVHAAADTEYDWAWYGGLVGAYFTSHPPVQEAIVRVADSAHPSTRHLPAEWRRTDEWYDYKSRPVETVGVLLTVDESTYEGGTMGGNHPIAWRHEYDGGRALYTGGGHTAESFSEADFVQHLLGAITWAAGERE